MDLLVAALAFALGLLVGISVGAVRAFRLVQQRRAAQGTAAGFARLWPETMPERSAADILAGRIRVVLGNVPYDLPVLSRGESRRWLETLDSSYASLATALDQAGDDTPALIAAVYSQQQALLDMLLSYDQAGVLPDRAHLDEHATDAEIFRAVLEVWRATNPLAATLAEMRPDAPPTSGSLPEPPSTPPSPTAGALTTSTPI